MILSFSSISMDLDIEVFLIDTEMVCTYRELKVNISYFEVREIIRDEDGLEVLEMMKTFPNSIYENSFHVFSFSNMIEKEMKK